MKFIVLALALFCAVAYATAQVEMRHGPPRPRGPNIPRFPEGVGRFRRETKPQGSVRITGTKPLSGPDRRPSLDVDYNHHLYDRNGMTAGAYGGVNIRPGQPAQPHFGVQAERQFRNGFIRGHGQVQRGPGGRPDPTFGLTGGFRFRRDVDDLVEEVEEY